MTLTTLVIHYIHRDRSIRTKIKHKEGFQKMAQLFAPLII